MAKVETEKTEKNRPDHLFKPGQSGNPKGRPKGAGISITTAIKRELEKIPEGKKATHLDLLVKKILEKGIIDGDSQTIKQIWNYIDGMPMQEHKHQGEFKHEITDEQALKIISRRTSSDKDTGNK